MRAWSFALAALMAACGSRTGTLDTDAMDAGLRGDSGASVDAGGPLDAGQRDAGARADAGIDAPRCETPDHGGAPVFLEAPASSLLGRACRFRRDECRSRDAYVVCVDASRDPLTSETTCRRCERDEECDFEYRSYGPRARSFVCRGGTCVAPPGPSALGECDSTRECAFSLGQYACVDHHCVHCCDNDECSTDRIGICEDAGTCAFPIPPG